MNEVVWRKKFRLLDEVLRLEAVAGNGKSGSSSRAPNQNQKFIFPPELSPNNWLPVQHFLYLGEPSKVVEVEVEVGLRVRGLRRGELGVVVEQFEDERSRTSKNRNLQNNLLKLLKPVKIFKHNVGKKCYRSEF